MRYINKQSDSLIKLMLQSGELSFSAQFEIIQSTHSCLQEFGIKTLEHYNLLLKAMKDGDILASDLVDPSWFKECFKCVINEQNQKEKMGCTENE